MTDAKNEGACGASLSDAVLGADSRQQLLTIPGFLRNQQNLLYEKEEEFKAMRFDDEYIEKQLRRVAAMRGDGKVEESLACHAAECIARLRQAKAHNGKGEPGRTGQSGTGGA